MDKLPVILLILSLVLLAFHFQDSCRLSGVAAATGAILAGAACFIAAVKKKQKLALFSLLAIIAHMLLVH